MRDFISTHSGIVVRVILSIVVVAVMVAAAICSDTWIPVVIGSLVVVKAKLLTMLSGFWSTSQKKFLIFLKTLTVYKTFAIGIKRFLIDNYFSKWLEKNVINPIKNPISGYFAMFKRLPWKEKIKRVFMGALPVGVVGAILSAGGFLEGALFYAEIKAFVIAFFKLLWIFGAQAFNFIANSWVAPILEIFALSYLLSWIEKIPYLGRPIVIFSDWVSKKMRALYVLGRRRFRRHVGKHIDRHVSDRVRGKLERYADAMHLKLNGARSKNEIFVMRKIIKDPQAYFDALLKKFSNLKTPEEKKEALLWLNKKINDTADVQCFYDTGEDWSEAGVHGYFIVESLASLNDGGNDHGKIKKEHFWMINLSSQPVLIDVGKKITVKPKKVKLIKGMHAGDFPEIEGVEKHSLS